MGSSERYDAFALMQRFRPDEAALGEALTLFIDRPDFGFVWLAYLDDRAVGCVSVGLAIDTETGGITATLRDIYVVPDYRRRALGSALLVTLEGRLTRLEVTRVDAIGGTDPALRPFLERRGYRVAGAVFTPRR